MTVQLNDLNDKIALASAPVGSVPAVYRPGIYRNGLKRAFDVSAVVFSLVIVVPVILMLALLVARDGHLPFYWSDRVGRGGRVFRMLKLRTMVPNADLLLDEHLATDPEARFEWEKTQKLKSDPRITRFGRFLRKSSLDELPQLWNVLVGDMSLVGPRPMMPAQRQLYPGLSYYSLRPGITGLWQVSDRNECTFAQRADYDRTYEQNLKFSEDLRLLLATANVVRKGTGY